jgi:cytochrome c-type biogenesis protein CcmH
MRRLRLLALAALLLSSAAGAVLPDEQLADPALEARARAISKQLRCVVCQNQSIDDSDAPLARDLRVIVREQLSAGKSDAETMDFVVARYGNFVLLKPPFEPATWALWFAPLIVVLAGGVGVAIYLRGRRHAVADGPELTPEERARVEALLRDADV